MVQYFEDNNIVALKGDRDRNPEVDPLLIELGNASKAIPYYAIFTKADSEPVHFDGVFITPDQFLQKLKPAVEEGRQSETVAVANETNNK